MNEIIKEYIVELFVNKLQRIGIESIHIKWMNEIIKDYIRQTSCKIVVNKLQKVLTYIILWQMDEMSSCHFFHQVGMCVGIWCGN
jgi:ATP-dependent Lon protease